MPRNISVGIGKFTHRNRLLMFKFKREYDCSIISKIEIIKNKVFKEGENLGIILIN